MKVFVVLLCLIPGVASATTCKDVRAWIKLAGSASAAESVARSLGASDADISQAQWCIISHRRVRGRASTTPATR